MRVTWSHLPDEPFYFPANFVARDQLGVKQLYYRRDEESLLFASEVRALLASGQISMRKVDGCQSPGQPPAKSMIDLAA